jgi:hypothetical protein
VSNAATSSVPAGTAFLSAPRANIEFNNVEVARAATDARPSFRLGDVSGAYILHLKLPRCTGPVRELNDASDFRLQSKRGFNDISICGTISHLQI